MANVLNILQMSKSPYIDKNLLSNFLSENITIKANIIIKDVN